MKSTCPLSSVAILLMALLSVPREVGRDIVLAKPDCGCTADAQTPLPQKGSALPVSDTSSPPDPVLAPTDEPHVHDPTIVRAGNHYFLFSTGRGIPIWVSTDRKTWHRAGHVFDTPPAWAADLVPGLGASFWAPSVCCFRGKWHLYYSVSTFGENRSAIGLATCAVLNPGHPGAGWQDAGMVVQSTRADDYNAIDPDLFIDTNNDAWLTFGSFWGGIKLISIDLATGKPPVPAPPLVSLAARSRTPALQGSVEAPFLFKRGAWYYLFVSFDFCCRGVDSTYNIRVGRSASVTGPYFDRDHVAMLAGGGTPVLAGSGRWRGPGHCSVLQDHGDDFLVHHAYDADDHGVSKLRIERLAWDTDGWPHPSPAP